MRTDKYMMAKAWMKQDQAPQAEALDTWNTLEAEFNDERKAMLMASAESDKIKNMMNKKYGPGTMKYGSEISQPPARPDVIQIDAINAFMKRNPAAEGGRQGFDKGLEVKKFVAGSGPGTGSALEAKETLKKVKVALNKIKKQKNNKNLFEWSEDSDWYKKLKKDLGGMGEKGLNREYTNKLINQAVEEFFPGSYHGKNAIKNFRNDMVVKSFIQHLKSVGEFDGQEKFDKVLDQFTYRKDGKRKDAMHLYEDINRSWKSWLNGEFEVDGIDRADLKKELKARGINYNQITNWSASSAQGRGTAKIKEIKWLDNQNSKFFNRTPEQVKALFKKQFPNGNFELRINELTQLKRNGVYVSGANTEKGITGISKGDRAGWLKKAYGKQFAGNYSKIINAADQLAAAGETAKAERLYRAADKFFGPTGIIRKSAIGEAEHALARSFDFLNPDRQLAINSIVDGDLNQFKKNLFDIPVKQYVDEYNKEGTTNARKKELKNLIENRKKTMNALTGGQTKGIVAGDIVSFQYGDKIKPTSSVKAIDVLFDEGKFNIDEYIAKGNAYGDSLKKTGLKIEEFTSPIGENQFKTMLQKFCGYGQAQGGRIGLSNGSCSLDESQKGFTQYMEDAKNGKISTTSKAGAELAENAAKLAGKSMSFGKLFFGWTVAPEVVIEGAIGLHKYFDKGENVDQILAQSYLTKPLRMLYDQTDGKTGIPGTEELLIKNSNIGPGGLEQLEIQKLESRLASLNNSLEKALIDDEVGLSEVDIGQLQNTIANTAFKLKMKKQSQKEGAGLKAALEEINLAKGEYQDKVGATKKFGKVNYDDATLISKNTGRGGRTGGIEQELIGKTKPNYTTVDKNIFSKDYRPLDEAQFNVIENALKRHPDIGMPDNLTYKLNPLNREILQQKALPLARADAMNTIGMKGTQDSFFKGTYTPKEKPVYDFSEGGITGLRSKYEYKK